MTEEHKPKPETLTGVRLDGSSATITVNQLEWRPGVYAVVLNAKSQLLALENLKTNKKELPGGGVDIWETLEAAVIREVWEETGLNVTVERLLDAGEQFYVGLSGRQYHTLHFIYLAHPVDGTLRDTIIEGELTVNPHWLDLAAVDPEAFHLGQAAIRRILEEQR